MIVKKVVYSCDIINCKASGEDTPIPHDWLQLQLLTPDNKRVVQTILCPFHSEEIKHNLGLTYSPALDTETSESGETENVFTS